MSSDELPDDLSSLAFDWPSSDELQLFLTDLMHGSFPLDPLPQQLEQQEQQESVVLEQRVSDKREKLMNQQLDLKLRQGRRLAADQKLQQLQFRCVQLDLQVRAKAAQLSSMAAGLGQHFMREEVGAVADTMLLLINSHKSMDKAVAGLKADAEALVSAAVGLNQMQDVAVQTDSSLPPPPPLQPILTYPCL